MHFRPGQSSHSHTRRGNGRYCRIVLKKPLADGLELVALALGVSWIELRREIVKAPHASAM